MWPQRWQPTRLPRPWDSPGKNTGVGCHFLPWWHKWLKKMPANAGDVREAGSIPGLGRYPGGGNGNPLQYSSWNISCLWDVLWCWVLVYVLRPEISAEGGALPKPKAPLFLCLFSSLSRTCWIPPLLIQSFLSWSQRRWLLRAKTALSRRTIYFVETDWLWKSQASTHLCTIPVVSPWLCGPQRITWPTWFWEPRAQALLLNLLSDLGQIS